MTGASRGIGRGLAIELARLGSRLYTYACVSCLPGGRVWLIFGVEEYAFGEYCSEECSKCTMLRVHVPVCVHVCVYPPSSD